MRYRVERMIDRLLCRNNSLPGIMIERISRRDYTEIAKSIKEIADPVEREKMARQVMAHVVADGKPKSFDVEAWLFNCGVTG